MRLHRPPDGYLACTARQSSRAGKEGHGFATWQIGSAVSLYRVPVLCLRTMRYILSVLSRIWDLRNGMPQLWALRMLAKLHTCSSVHT